MSVKFEKIVQEDLDAGTGQVERTMPGGGTALGTRINPQSFPALAFRAQNSSPQAVVGGGDPGSAADAILHVSTDASDLQTFDPMGWFDNDTYRWTPQVAGLYWVHVYMTITNLTGQAWVNIYRNASEWVSDQETQTLVAGAGTAQTMALVFMNGVDDYLTIRVEHTDGVNSRNVTQAVFEAFPVGYIEASDVNQN